ncbi:hypothetical protein GCM10011348_40790 [Marinobacterium nitratireducens]|uniref:Uncharacterized protein n=1 Tax=Marinobacterium nitratireducens TaxID=518897 RepID=A0A918DXU8_9GAMM|nr:hypothetical protein [Marinobacterium nitratireducens]GGO87486.1 hypothetical protein GCM10011348_40790 [Marinobacterium nitratireducens]
MNTQQQDNSSLLARARELRALLLDYIAGGPAQAPKYKQLRDELLAATSLQSLLPPLLGKYEKLDDLWHAMKYQVPSKIERQELIRKEFEPLIETLDGSAQSASSAETEFRAVNTSQLLKGWLRLNEQAMEPKRRLSNGVKVLVQVCSSIIDVHYRSLEIRGGNTDPTQVFEMAKDVLFASSAETDKQILVADTVAGASALFKSLDEIREQFARGGVPEKEQPALASAGADLALNSAMALLSCWQMLRTLHDTAPA